MKYVLNKNSVSKTMLSKSVSNSIHTEALELANTGLIQAYHLFQYLTFSVLTVFCLK